MNDVPATPEARRQSLAEWETILKRYPLASPWGLAWQALTVLSGNVVVAWLVTTGRMSPLELVLLVAVEAVLLVVIAWVQSKFVPPEAIKRSKESFGQKLFVFLFGMVWLGAVYGLVLGAFVPQGAEVKRLLDDPVAFLLVSYIKWPLLITLAGALVDALQDHAHYGRHGGIFLSTPGMQGVARFLTLFLGGIPFFMPIVAVAGGLFALISKIGEWIRARTSGAGGQNLWMLAAMPLMSVAFFATFGWLVTSEVSGWAVGYATAKFAAELFIVCLPLIAKKAHEEESAGIYRVKGKKVKMRRLP